MYGVEVPEMKVGQQGGQHAVKLEIKHMPSHTHPNPTQGSGSTGITYALDAVGRGELRGKHPRPTGDTGGGLPHQNMPPYIALHLCRQVKDIPDTAD